MLRGNPDHAGAKPRWDKVTLKPVTNTGARVAGLLAGDFDMIVDPAAQDLPRIKQRGGFAWTATPSDRIMFLQPDIGRASSPQVTTPDGRNPLQDPRVRRAISLAIDRRAIVERLMDGLAVAADQYAPPAMPGAVADPPPRQYDPVAAKKLLAEAGYPDGFALTLAATNDRYINDAKVAQALGQFLTRIGIKVNVDVMPQTVFFPSRPKRLFSLSLGGWGLGDASRFCASSSPRRTAEHGVGTSNYGGYSSAAFDQRARCGAWSTWTRSGATANWRTRRASRCKDDALIPLYWETTVWAYKDRYTYTGRVDQLTDVDGLSENEVTGRVMGDLRDLVAHAGANDSTIRIPILPGHKLTLRSARPALRRRHAGAVRASRRRPQRRRLSRLLAAAGGRGEAAGDRAGVLERSVSRLRLVQLRQPRRRASSAEAARGNGPMAWTAGCSRPCARPG